MKVLDGFKQFILRGNVVDLAVGVVIGAAFGSLVNSLVTDILTPFIGALIQVSDFSGLTFVVNGSTFTYGNFINSLIAFCIVAASVYFFVVLPINTFMRRFKKEENIPHGPNEVELLQEIRDLLKNK